MEAVPCERFSPLNSLLTGKNTGNFSIFSQVPAENFTYPLESTGVLIPLSKLSVAENREFFAPEQRIIRHVSGKRHFPDITKCLSGSSIFFTMRPAPAPRLIGASDEIAPTDAASRAIWQVTGNAVFVLCKKYHSYKDVMGGSLADHRSSLLNIINCA